MSLESSWISTLLIVVFTTRDLSLVFSWSLMSEVVIADSISSLNLSCTREALSRYLLSTISSLKISELPEFVDAVGGSGSGESSELGLVGVGGISASGALQLPSLWM